MTRFQRQLLAEIHDLNKTLKVIVSNQERVNLNEIEKKVNIRQNALIKKLRDHF